MPVTLQPRTGGRILADQLRIHGVDHAFGVPGESYLALLDALHDTPEIAFTVCRQEGGAAFMAEAYGKLTGRPGVCLVTRGPGATNAAIGVHLAQQDSTPMVLIVGQVGRDMMEREAFQEIDYRRFYGSVAKWAAQVDDPTRLPELVSHAFHTAVNGRPGPVVLAVPEDVLRAEAAVADAPSYRRAVAHPAPEAMTHLRSLLERAERPFVLVGGGGWSARAKADLEAFAEANGLPVGTAFRCQDYMDNTHPCYVGDVGIGINPALAQRVREADLLLVVGARLGEMTTGGYTLVEPPRPRQTLVHVHAGPEELGRVYHADLPVNAASEAFLAAARALPPVGGEKWAAWRAAARADYEAFQEPRAMPGAVDLGRIMVGLRDVLPDNAIIANGAGNYAAWVHRFLRWRTWRTQLAPTAGTMGYGLPAAVAAARVHPDRPVICFAGDGCFLMNGQELATAVHHRLRLVVVVVDNGMYGTIRMHQERTYPGRTFGTDLTNPDFAALARSYGAHGETVTRTEDFAGAFARAQAADGPALIALRVDPDAISPRATLSEIREQTARTGR